MYILFLSYHRHNSSVGPTAELSVYGRLVHTAELTPMICYIINIINYILVYTFLTIDQCDPKLQYQCTDGSCIDDADRCNGNNDCSDGGDENTCTAIDSNRMYCCVSSLFLKTVFMYCGTTACTSYKIEEYWRSI